MQNEEPGLQPIGGPLSKIVNTLQITDSTPEALPNNSVTTGSRPPARKPRNATGLQRGERGADVKPSVWQTDRALEASLPAPLRTLLSSNAIYDSGFENLLRYEELPPARNAVGEAMLEQARAVLDAALVPAEPAAVLKILARLKISTSYRSYAADDAKLERRVYADELRGYPLDVIDEACRKWARREQWWPSVAEIVEECNKLSGWRRVTRAVLA